MKNKSFWLLPTLIIPFLGLTALMVAAGSGQVVPPPVSAKLHHVEAAPVELQSSYRQQQLAYGRVEASKQARAGFELAGTLLTVLVDEGDRVKADQLLAKLDTARLDARMLELDAALARAQAEARLAALSEQRVAELVKKNLESPQRLDEVRESTVAAKAVVTEIQARKDSVAVELQKSELRAPFDGAILSRPVDPGTVVAAGQTILTMQQESRLEVRIALAANDAFSLREGEDHMLKMGELGIKSQIKSIAKQRKLNTRTVDVIFSVPEGQVPLLPGDLLAFSYEKEISEAGIWVPRKALNSGIRGLWTLFTVSQGGESKISSKAVEVLYTEQDRVYVRGALKPQDLLVINGTQRLVPDQLVQVNVQPALQFALGN